MAALHNLEERLKHLKGVPLEMRDQLLNLAKSLESKLPGLTAKKELYKEIKPISDTEIMLTFATKEDRDAFYKIFKL